MAATSTTTARSAREADDVRTSYAYHSGNAARRIRTGARRQNQGGPTPSRMAARGVRQLARNLVEPRAQRGQLLLDRRELVAAPRVAREERFRLPHDLVGYRVDGT